VVDNAPASRNYTGGFGSDLMLKRFNAENDRSRKSHNISDALECCRFQQLYQMHSGNSHGALDFPALSSIATKD
jgi:3-hydroxyisobutyrate dehydrogenase